MCTFRKIRCTEWRRTRIMVAHVTDFYIVFIVHCTVISIYRSSKPFVAADSHKHPCEICIKLYKKLATMRKYCNPLITVIFRTVNEWGSSACSKCNLSGKNVLSEKKNIHYESTWDSTNRRNKKAKKSYRKFSDVLLSHVLLVKLPKANNQVHGQWIVNLFKT